MNYKFSFIYPTSKDELTVREMLKELLIPRKWQHLLRTEKNITINGKYRNFNEKVVSGDKVDFNLDFVESEQQTYPASGQLPKIIYEDENVLVIDKKKGQKTHPNLNETDTALNDCATYLGYSPYIVHRLDMLTGGLLLVAKNPAVVPILNRELTNKSFHREYLAKVNLNKDIPNSDTINFPIGQDPDDKRKRMVRVDGLRAVTHYQIVDRNGDIATVKVSLETGRTHQIRVHLSSIGCPIIGDPLYNLDYSVGQELQLTAFQMSFIEPFSFRRIQVRLF